MEQPAPPIEPNNTEVRYPLTRREKILLALIALIAIVGVGFTIGSHQKVVVKDSAQPAVVNTPAPVAEVTPQTGGSGLPDTGGHACANR